MTKSRDSRPYRGVYIIIIIISISSIGGVAELLNKTEFLPILFRQVPKLTVYLPFNGRMNMKYF